MERKWEWRDPRMREERQMWRGEGTRGRREECGVKIGRGRDVKRWNETELE